MNRNIYRLIFNITSGMTVPAAETARSRGKWGRRVRATSGRVLLSAGLLLATSAQAELPVPCAGGSCGIAIPDFVTTGQANYHIHDHQAVVNQVGDKAILNWESFNVSPGHSVQFQQVDSLAAQNLVQGANFITLNRIWDNDPSVIAGILTQAAGQNANVILVNTNGIAFTGSSQVNLGSFTASSLDIKDSFILNAFLTTQKTSPQFEGSGGFIKVLEGARITAGSQGRVMLIAPTVINKGSVQAPDGQVITAAGTKVFLRSASNQPVDANVRGLLVEVDSPAGLSDFQTDNPGIKDGKLDGQTVALKDGALDKLGHVTNLGELSTPRGNVTMVGYAVNQQGIARATTSVIANGSVYLLAKDSAFAQDNSTRGGRVVLADGSRTEVLPEVSDNTGLVDGLTGTGLALRSQVRVLGQDIRMENGAIINAPAGEVNFFAMDDPSLLFTGSDPFQAVNAPISNTARVHIAGGARISVSGLENVAVSTARNGVEVELRGDELKDSPANRDGPLRSQKVFVDINRALNNANAGNPTLIARDSLLSYQARLERGVAERSTEGGTVRVSSLGEAIIESGAVIDLSGGSLSYTPANVPTTLVMSRGILTDIADARADVRYDGIATRYTQDFGRWNIKEVIDLGRSFNYDPGYIEGKNAGALEVTGLRATVMQGDIQGRTIVGEVQRDLGIVPAGARFTLGVDPVAKSFPSIDYKMNQVVELSSSAALPAGFKFGDALSPDLVRTVSLNPGLLGKDKVANLEIFSNQAAAVREALRAPQGGSVHITAQGITIDGDIEAPSGSIVLNASRNDFNTLSEPLNLIVANGVTLSARGAWVNELRGVPAGSDEVALVHGGNIALSAQDNLALGHNTLLDVTGGGRLRVDGQGRVIAGSGGEISLAGLAVSRLDQNVRGYGIGGGGTLTVSSNRIQIGGVPDNSLGTVNLDTGFFERAGFANINLAGIERLALSEGVRIKPTVLSLELQPDYTLRPSGSRIENFTHQVKLDDLVRQPVNLSLAARNSADGTGDLLIEKGAHIEADPRASVTLEAGRLLDIRGRITAPGGNITATLNHSQERDFNPTNALWLGKQAVLDVSGVALTYLDKQRLTQGTVLNGGNITLNAQFGYVVAETGSSIRMAGVAPVRLDILNQAGGVGQWVGSDAGSLSIKAREGVLLDGGMAAQGGSTLNRGGTFSLVFGFLDIPEKGFPTGERILSLAQTVTPQTSGLTPGAALPAGLNGKARLGAAALKGAGFDRITLKSRDAIRLENGLNLGANRALALKEVALDAPRIETAGGDAALKAETLRLGNYDVNRVDAVNTPVTGSGALKADAQLLELAGNLTLTGMARAELNGAEEVRLAGVSSGSSARPAGAFSSAADLFFRGAVIAPTTYSQISINAPGRTVAFSSDTMQQSQPLSALGSLAVTAANVVQAGNLWAPFGQLNFIVSDTLTFKSGSLTSIAGAPGSLIPFGITVNGRSWIYRPDSFEIPQLALPEKSIRIIQAANVDMQAGAAVRLAGGGDLQAYEFSVGPGGARDILDDPGTYAILPGYANGFAPGDRQENAGFDRAAGDAVYLSGIPGLSAGVYTLLPAHYALLPGAYAVRLNAHVQNLLPGQAYSRQDGIQVVPGYITDSRAASGGPRDALWSGFEVLTREQVLQRSEINLSRASDFFTISQSRPQDAGLLSIATTGGLKLDAIFQLSAAEGGRGAAVDISALKIAITDGSPSGVDPLATRIDATTLDAMGAASLFLGGTRTPGSTRSDATILTVGADEVTLANDISHPLKSQEIILAARNTLTLKSGSAIDAQGSMDNVGGAGSYRTAGNGALVRAASTYAAFSRTDSPDRTLGILTGEAGSTIRASNSITLDATLQNTFAGTTIFADDKGNPVAGNLSVGATRVNLGNAPTGSEGLVLNQSELDRLNSLNSLTLTSYSTFDLYGDVGVGGINADGKPTLQALNLLGAGLAGLNNSDKTAHLRAASISISNPAAATFTSGGTPGNGALAIQADRLVLGEGSKAIQGFSQIDATANELVGRGAGSTDTAGKINLNIARVSAEPGSNQTLAATGQLNAAKVVADRTLAAVDTLGAKWTLSGTRVTFDTQADLPSGALKLVATTGNLELGTNAELNVAGKPVAFFDVVRPSPGGTVELASDNGNVLVQTGGRIDVSAAAGGNAGSVIIRAPNGTATVNSANLQGSAALGADGARGEGGRFQLDVASLNDFSTLNTILNQGVFDGARTLRVRTGDVSLAAADTVKAREVRIAADGGKLDVAAHIDASGKDGGNINLYARNDVAVQSSAKLDAYATGDGQNGGEVEIGTTEGRLSLADGGTLDVHGGGSGGQAGQGGSVLLRAPRTGSGAGNDAAVGSVASSIDGARSIVVEAVKVYNNITTLTGTGASSGATLSLATVNSDNASFASSAGAIAARLGKAGDTAFHVRAGVEVRSAGDLALSQDWNLGTSRTGGEPGMLTLRAAGNLNLNSNLSDGFNAATAFSSGTTPATLLAGDSWGYRLVAGADTGAVDPLTVKAGSGDVTLAAGKLVRTGTGDIHIASGHNIKLADNKSAIYTAGRIADVANGFVVPANAQFSQGGGNVSLSAQGDISGAPSAQLYSNWLFRQGQLNQSTGAYTLQPAWWVRFDQFQQGIGALGGGDVTLIAGGNVKNVSASTPTQARMAATAPDVTKLVTTGGGDVRVETGGDLLGGQYYADRGDLVLKVGGKVDSGQNVKGSALYTILALGDAQARVQTQEDLNIQAILNPHLVVQSSGTGTAFNIGSSGVRDPRWSLFSTYGPNSGVQVQSLDGDVTLHTGVGGLPLSNAYGSPLNFNISPAKYSAALLSILPPSLSATAFHGNTSIQGSENITLSPAARADLALLASNSVSIANLVAMSDRDPALIPSAVRPDTGFNLFPNPAVNPADINLIHAAVPVHTGDTQPARIYAVAGDVQGDFNTLTLDLSKAVQIRAGQDVRDLGIVAQHVNAGDVSRVVAGRDVAFTSGNDRTNNAKIWIGGLGRLEVTAGRNIDLGTSAGIVSRGDLDNAQLPKGGVDIHVAAGVGAQGIDYTGAIDRLIAELSAAGSTANDALLWQARWLTGNNTLKGSDALEAVQAVRALDADTQRIMVREMVYTALLVTGRDFNNRDSPYARNYERGYAALELLFPGLREKNADGSFKNYQGEINLFASRIKTERGGNIEFMVPGGDLIVGLSNTPAVLVNTGNDVLGMLTVADGNIRGFSRGNILVNQSRILTVGGGNVLLWSSEGDIDAGKGKKSATAVPPPLIKVDASGKVTQELQGAASGSGIGALSTGATIAGDIDLIAPKGTVNAGDAGIRAGNLNIAAQVVLGADNIAVAGTSTGTPVADASAVSATTSGATSQGDDVAKATAALSQNLSDAAQAADQMRKLKPTFISAEVIGHGE
ncbi:filamentous haemagglutinin family protein [Nitrosovibrio tenuis]|uniref:Filamentous hemagglutinin family N-terminal domain-containing protein n=1 Tax=Nitrosovibrio tenuis TaxID=1233 RepID=A0A1H7LT15_9PROT|nr:filamentous haemagglutinin family protein [Nitrosovibrio tenuis]SEL01497.1 filamentous hemagglutinin family N-terminal domain-containing protein [Nitrosovibrio tenuis]